MGAEAAAAGLTRRVLDCSAELGAPGELPVVEVQGRQPGPHLCVLAGVHGCEYTAIEALRRFLRQVDPEHLHGRVTALPLVSTAAFRARSPFVSPVDGKNLNRCFPGDPGGSYSERLAAVVFERFVTASDYLIDLHSGDLVEALHPFVMYDESAVVERTRRMARAFGIPTLVAPRRAERIDGTSMAAAADRGIPGMTAEAGGLGVVDSAAADVLCAGVFNVLRLLAGETAPARTPTRTFHRSVWLYAPRAGYWTVEHAVGEAVSAGDRLGTVADLFGEEAVEVTAPVAGLLLFATVNPAVAENGVLVGLGAEPVGAAEEKGGELG